MDYFFMKFFKNFIKLNICDFILNKTKTLYFGWESNPHFVTKTGF